MDNQPYQRAMLYILGLDKRYKANKKVGWVYLARARQNPEVGWKIGMTSRPPPERLRELSQHTGVPGGFELVYFVHVTDRTAAEIWVHGTARPFTAPEWLFPPYSGPGGPTPVAMTFTPSAAGHR